MKIKRYVVTHLREAMPLIRQELGQDAVILNTKKVKVGGIFGLFRKQRLEVLAALDEEKVAKEKTEFATLLQSEKKRREATPERVEELVPKVDKQSVEAETQVLGELKSMKEIMMQMMENERLPKQLKPVQAFLEAQEFSQAIRSGVMAELLIKSKSYPSYTKEEAFIWMRQEFAKRIKNYPSIGSASKKVRCFVGPTGVGKTTTIAKIAGHLLLKERQSVGLITSDTYRIAAVEQLRTYADILGIPMEVVQSPSDLEKSLERLSACDVILMDTAGRNYQQYSYITQLETLLSGQEMSITLMLSLTHRYSDMKLIADNFHSLGVLEVIMTKMDETTVRGPIFNFMEDYNLPITILTTGQNVPDDLVRTTPDFFLDLVMEGRGNG
ncbi:flagellar biosynthesis protein FlhF [Alkalihalobacillus hwajinpoensis]|uniref:flagellar biosynthesis protein FlhF n=1 Tax=Guptibacillus hwajinpoensis TaxID=208199 RepID=UPI001883EE58|nr:flagellar biosynthesis protein FlhF [Pseudalkalibacillus hwajinpoensis]MBF0705175.1 flagellar biosynthesis protein FlhF [Pseudalkalibacillus hwajinpoensis]